MPRKSDIPFGHIAVPVEVLATALYGLGHYEGQAIKHRGDGLRPGTHTCQAVAWLWENGHRSEVANVIGSACAVLRGEPVPGGVGRITHLAVIDAFGAELAHMHLTPEEGWEPVAEYLRAEVPRGF